MNTNKSVKEILTEFVNQLADDCSWDDVMRHVFVRQKIEAGIEDAENGRLHTHEEVFAEFDDA